MNDMFGINILAVFAAGLRPALMRAALSGLGVKRTTPSLRSNRNVNS